MQTHATPAFWFHKFEFTDLIRELIEQAREASAHQRYF